MIKIYGEEPDISHLTPEEQDEILKQIKRRTAELIKDINRMLEEHDEAMSGEN